MNRADFQKLAQLRIADARVLLSHGRPEAAYYLAGYAVECALKACIAKQTARYDFPIDKERAGKVYSHNLQQLLDLSGVQVAFKHEVRNNSAFELNWGIVKDWDVRSRYSLSHSRVQAQDLYGAVTARKSGVLVWLRRHW